MTGIPRAACDCPPGDWEYSPTGIRSTAATQAAQVWRVHWAGSLISGCSLGQPPARLGHHGAEDTSAFGASVDVAYQRSTQPRPGLRAPVIARAVAVQRRGRRVRVPESGHRPVDAVQSPGKYWPIAGSARIRASASLDRSSSSGLRLSSSTWQISGRQVSFAAA